MFPRRVHLVPVAEGCSPEDAVQRPLAEGADIVHLLVADTDPAVAAEIETRLEDEGVTVEAITVDQTNVYELFGLVTTIADGYDEDDHIRVNVSTGTRQAAIGATLGSMDEDTPVRAYFADGDADEAPAAEAGTAESGAVVPDYPIESPSKEEVAMLAITVTENTALTSTNKRTLIDRTLEIYPELDDPFEFAEYLFAKSRQAPNGGRTGEHDTPQTATEPTTLELTNADDRRAAYGKLRPTLDTLKERGYLTTTERGASEHLEVTPVGENTLRAFRHKITDVIAALDDDQTPAYLTDGVDAAVR